MSGMGRREFVALLGGAAAWPVAARAQEPGCVYRLGAISEREKDRLHGQRGEECNSIVWMGWNRKCSGVNKQHTRNMDGNPSGDIVQNSDSGTASSFGVSRPMRARYPRPSGRHPENMVPDARPVRKLLLVMTAPKGVLASSTF